MLIKGIPPYILVYFFPQICTDLRGVKNQWEIGRNTPTDGKEYTLLLKDMTQNNLLQRDTPLWSLFINNINTLFSMQHVLCFSYIPLRVHFSNFA